MAEVVRASPSLADDVRLNDTIACCIVSAHEVSSLLGQLFIANGVDLLVVKDCV